MSSSSQSTGTNYVTLTGVSTTGGVSVRGWSRVNSWTKSAYASLIDGNANWGIGQDPLGGAGTVQQIQGWCHNSGGFLATNNITTAIGEWFFWCCTISGTVFTTYWAKEGGPLYSSGGMTVDAQSATIPIQFAAEAVFNDETGDHSYREIVVWPATALTPAQVLAERNAGMSGPRTRVANMSYIRTLAAAPEVASVGSAWTRTGTFVVGPDDPKPASRSPLVLC